MTALTTAQMIDYAKVWMQQQTASTPRDILSSLRDMAIALLSPDNPPSQVPVFAPTTMSTAQTIELGCNWLNSQYHLTSIQFLAQVRDGSIGYLNALPSPVPVAGNVRGVMFVPATAGMPNNQGVSSQLDYRGVHGKSNENNIRVDMLQCVKNWGGNMLSYIRGEFNRNNPVLDMALNGMRHPGDGHWFPVKAPTANDGEVDWAMWAKQAMGIEKHLCWIWNDNNSTPFTENIVAEAIASYNGCRLGMENVMFGTGLESNEVMSVDTAVAACGWIHSRTPSSPVIVGSANEGYLQQVGSRVRYALLWLEQAPSLLANPLTRATFPDYLASLNRLSAQFGKARVIPGEYWASNPVDMKWMTDQLLVAGYTFLGSGKYN